MKVGERRAWTKYAAAREGAKKARRPPRSSRTSRTRSRFSPAELEAALDDLVAEADRREGEKEQS
jgi:hypothetical protein